jgi:peptidoglycan LD-endopeptidase CwlK
MTFAIGTRSRERLQGVHADLVKVVERALQLSLVDFTVVEGLRTVKRQEQLVAQGASRTMNSRHITGHAVDLAPIIDGKVSFAWPPFYDIAEAMKKAATELGVAIVWGGDWRTFKDGPHFELDRKEYP